MKTTFFAFSGVECLPWHEVRGLLGERRECTDIELALLKKESNPREDIFPWQDTQENRAIMRRIFEMKEEKERRVENTRVKPERQRSSVSQAADRRRQKRPEKKGSNTIDNMDLTLD